MRGCQQHYSNMEMTSVLMLKRIFSLTLRAFQGSSTLFLH
ncbi:MAG: hypothetical protein G5663_02220 [Serratia symbiotica]|nr:hypothetical protein [Serratia symbiotica]